jgi:hypothetical protein
MRPVFRATTSEDAPAITSFLARCFAVDPASDFLRPDLLHWKLWAPREDYDGPRSFVLERNGEIIAHSGIWPMTLQTDSGTLQGAHMFDWASDVKVLGAGVSILRKLAESFDFLYANGGSDMTRKIIPNIGFEKVGEAWYAERPLRPVRQTFARRLDWKAPARLLRNSLRTISKLQAPPPGWSLREGIGEDVTRVRVLGTLPSAIRPASFFKYLRECPTARIRVFQLLKDDKLVGRIALSLVGHQARIIGVWLYESSQEARRAAYALAVQQARETTAAFDVVSMGSLAQSKEAVIDAGLRVRESTPVLWLTGKRAVHPTPFEFQMADNDSIFLG